MSWFSADGVQIYFEEEGSGDPVLLLPGLAESIDVVRGVRKALVPRYRVIAAELPGSGRSMPQPRQYTPDYYQDDAASFVALLRDRLDRPVHLVGFSDGGEVELLMAAMAPEVARSVCAWGTAGSIPLESAGMLDAMATIIDDPIEPLREYGAYLRELYGAENARVMMASWTAAARGIIERGGGIARERASDIVCPVLLIVGESDPFIPPSIVAKLGATLPRGETRIVPGAGHSVQEDQPAWLEATVLEFLDRGGQPRGT